MVSNSLLLSFRKVWGYCFHFSSNFQFRGFSSSACRSAVSHEVWGRHGLHLPQWPRGGAKLTSLTHSASAFRWIWLPAQLRGEGNGNPPQCSCRENPRDAGAWWAAVYGSHRVGHDWSDLAAAAAAVRWSELVVCIWIFPPFWTFLPPPPTQSHSPRSSRSSELSSLCFNMVINSNSSTPSTFKSFLMWMMIYMVTFVILPSLKLTR